MKKSAQSDRLQHDIVALEALPTLPIVALELVRRWHDPDLSIRSVTEIIARDPSLSAKVLQVANSTAFGLKKQVTSINHAAVLLGMNTLKCVTLGVTVFDSFSDQRAEWAKHVDLTEFWRHSLAVAVAAEMLSVRFGWGTPEEAFLAGLLHDIGKIGLFATHPEEYAELFSEASVGNRSLVEVESQGFGATHAEVGKWIAEKWGLPTLFRDAIWTHHQPPGPEPIHAHELGKVVYLADHVVRRARIGEAGNRFFFHDDNWLLERLDWSADDLGQFTGELLEQAQSLGEHLNIPMPTVQIYLKALQEANSTLSRGGLDSEQLARHSNQTVQILKTLSEIHLIEAHEGIEIDLLARAVEMVCKRFNIPWMMMLSQDTDLMTVEGVLYKDQLARAQTFYRNINASEEWNAEKMRDRKGFLNLLGETVLSSGKRVNLRDEVLGVLEIGQLVAIPLEVDHLYRGECLVNTSGTVFTDTEGRIALESIVEASADLQQRARLYRSLRRESEIAHEATRRESEALRQLYHIERLASVGRLAAGAAHEINNPLAVISGKAQLLLLDEKDQRRVSTLGDIIGQTERISKIITDLMGFARPTEPSVTDVKLESLIENAVQMAEHRVPKPAVRKEVDLDEELPTLRVDAKQIEQVLVNLFVNALQAMGETGELRVRGSFIATTGMVSIQVCDTGMGIPPSDIQKVFDPFFTTKREGEGTGLGLAVSQRIVEAHGGGLWVNSQVGVGTTFTIQLPSGADEETKALVKARRGPATVRATRKKQILLVDDEMLLAGLIQDYLTQAGYVVEHAKDGVEALERLAENVYDALVMDIRMPRKDGLEVLEELRLTSPGLPTLIITGLASREELDQAESSGAKRILRKPFQLDDLLHAVKELIAGS